MKLLTVLLLVLASSVFAVAGDVGHLTAAKARFISKLVHGKHHKRGIFSGVPTFKLGHDLPVVSHSIVKPLVVTYPPKSLPFAVKVPLINRFPLSIGHKGVHAHFGINHHPRHHHHHTKTFVKPDHHYHHHHHHVEPKPILPVLPAPPVTPSVVPLPTPTLHPLNPFPVPTPSVLVQPTSVKPFSTPVVHQPIPLAPAPVHFVPQPSVHFKLLYPTATIPQAPILRAPVVPASSPYSYVVRPGNAVQTSVFATYPRYPFVQSPLVSVPLPSARPLFLDHPAQVPHLHIQQEPHLQFQQDPQLNPALLQPNNVEQGHFFHPTGHDSTLEHDGWSPIHAQGYDSGAVHHEEVHHISQEQPVPQVYEHQAQDDQNYQDLQHQIHQHIQEQIEQAQYDQQNPQYGPPQVHHEYSLPTPDYNQQPQDLGQSGHEYGAPQPESHQEYGPPSQLSQDYSQHGFEGRSTEREENGLQFHNHIPLGFQPPIDRPPENFR